jgi:hypothetical protein
LRRRKGKTPAESISEVSCDIIRGNLSGILSKGMPDFFGHVDYNGDFDTIWGSERRMDIP